MTQPARKPRTSGTFSLQLEKLKRELNSASEQARALSGDLSEAEFRAAPTAGQWSVAECLDHLRITTDAYLPTLREAIAEGRLRGMTGDGPYRADLLGRLLVWIMEPPVFLRSRTPAPFVPHELPSRDEVVDSFFESQFELIACVEDAAGLDLTRLRIRSPFDSRFHYSLFSAFRLLVAHERRHLWQAQQAAEKVTRR